MRVPIIKAAAGAAGRGDPENPDRDDWVVEVGSGAIYPEKYIRLRYDIPPGRLRSVRIVGEIDGADHTRRRLLRHLPVERRAVRDGGVYLLASPHGTLLKRLRLGHVDTGHEDARGRPVSREVIRICSDNPSQEEYRLPPDVFERDYRILGWALEVEHGSLRLASQQRHRRRSALRARTLRGLVGDLDSPAWFYSASLSTTSGASAAARIRPTACSAPPRRAYPSPCAMTSWLRACKRQDATGHRIESGRS